LLRRSKETLWKADPWAWMTECCWTEDPDSHQFLKFPGDQPWAQYLKYIVDLYMEPDAHLVLIPKSRQMFLSWLSITLRVWRAAKFPHELIYFDALKLGLNEHEPGSALDMLRRAKIVLERLEHDRIPYKLHRTYIEFPETRSRIVAVGSGADQLRGVTPTDILMDECAFWPEAEATFMAARPAVHSGKIWLVSTVEHGSFFSNMRHDRTGYGKPDPNAIPIERVPHALAEGVLRYQNPRNRAHVLEIWPHANPLKRSAAWREGASAGMSAAAWRREQELDDTNVLTGTPVFEGVYDEATHTRQAPLRVDPRRPMLRSWDWGFRHPVCVVGQLFESKQLRLYAAWMGENVDLEPFAASCLRKCRERWPNMPFQDAGDFAGNQRKGVGMTEIDLLAMKFGLMVRSRYLTEIEPLAWLRKLMSTMFRPGEANFLIEVNPDTEELRRAFRGGYTLGKDGKPANDGFFEHLGDATKYLVNFEHDGTGYEAELDRIANADVIPEKNYSADWR
jgi:hypothetical protein